MALCGYSAYASSDKKASGVMGVMVLREKSSTFRVIIYSAETLDAHSDWRQSSKSMKEEFNKADVIVAWSIKMTGTRLIRFNKIVRRSESENVFRNI